MTKKAIQNDCRSDLQKGCQKGGNMYDVSQVEGLKLLVSYWTTFTEFTDADYIFVGDVHGDFNQFIAPLIAAKLIKLKPSVRFIDVDEVYGNDPNEPAEHDVGDKNNINARTKAMKSTTPIDSKIQGQSAQISPKPNKNVQFPESKPWIPEYTILDSCRTTIIYLGDLIDEWIFGRTIVHMLRELLTNEVSKPHIRFIYGNHDLSLIGRYNLFKTGVLKFPYDLPTTWNTIKKELNYSDKIKIFGDQIRYNNDPELGAQFLKVYMTPLFEDLYFIFANKLGMISCTGYINDVPYIISHTTWNPAALWRLFKNMIPNYASRPGDLIPSQKEAITNDKLSPKAVSVLEKLLSHENKSIEPIPSFMYEQLSWACNCYIYTRSRLYVSKNAISYSRNPNDVFVNQIIGHTPGGVFRNMGVNPEFATFDDEREKKLEPKIYNDCKIYYFDFLTSAGYDHDEVSRPDFVSCKNGEGSGFKVSKLNSFAFERLGSEFVLQVYKGKSKEKLMTLKGNGVSEL